MPDAAPEIVYTGAGKPPSWGERAGQFVKEKIIDPHTPEAHYQDIMKKYFWATDRLEGRPREIAQRLRPQVELAAKAAGWSQTFAELYLAGSALALTTIIAGKGLKSAAEVFGEMARRHGKQRAGETDILRPSQAVVIASSVRRTKLYETSGQNGTPLDNWFKKAILSALLDFERLNLRNEVAQVAGKEAWLLGDYLKEHTDIADDQRRHAQRAYAYMLQGLLSKDAKTSSGSTDPRKAFLEALEATKTRGEGLSDANIDHVFQALQDFNSSAL